MLKRHVLLSSLILAAPLFAASVGDPIDKVLAEKGKPAGRVDAGSTVVLTYEDTVIKCREGLVTEIKSAKGGNVTVTRTAAKPMSKAAPGAARSSQATWTSDYTAALDTAKAQQRTVFLFFTGSDWCGWCKKLNSEILNTPEFSAFAGEKLLLVELDYPRDIQQPQALVEQNQKLARQYKIEGYPTVVLLNPDGRQVARLGYQEGGPAPFIERLRGHTN